MELPMNTTRFSLGFGFSILPLASWNSPKLAQSCAKPFSILKSVETIPINNKILVFIINSKVITGLVPPLRKLFLSSYFPYSVFAQKDKPISKWL